MHTTPPSFWQSFGLTCANLQTRDIQARHPLALGSFLVIAVFVVFFLVVRDHYDRSIPSGLWKGNWYRRPTPN